MSLVVVTYEGQVIKITGRIGIGVLYHTCQDNVGTCGSTDSTVLN